MCYLPAGGHPGGAIQRADQTPAYMHFQAPAKFLGNLSTNYNGTLSYDMLQTVPDTTNWRHFSVALNAAAGWIVVPAIEDYIGTPVSAA